MPENKTIGDMTDAEILEVIQSVCKHPRALAYTFEEHMLFKCLDCGKYFYKKEHRDG